MMKLFWTLLTIMALCLIVSLSQDLKSWEKDYPVKEGCTYDIDYVKSRMKYHGIMVAHLDMSKCEWYFIRNGRRCKL